MRAAADIPSRKRGYGIGRSLFGYALIAGTVWLGWEIIKAPLVQRGPPALAVRLAPTSPEALRVAAEQELSADRTRNAIALADASLVRAPFNARAMRVRGLAASRLGLDDQANNLLTLAGNWSLRDDPTHAWLVEHRLRRGQFTSALAHADTLARRRPDLQPQLFNFFTVAASSDPRAIKPLVNLLAINPPWRSGFIEYLHEQPDGDALLLALALNLETSSSPFTDGELRRLYQRWLAEKRLMAIETLARRINRPPPSNLVQNGEFDTPTDKQIQPLDWQLGTGAGLTSEITEDDTRSGNLALRVGYDGFGSSLPAYQLLMLKPGDYNLSGQHRFETVLDEGRLELTLTCLESQAPIGSYRPDASRAGADRWRSFSMSVTVPADACSMQWLRLDPRPGDRRTDIGFWLDDITIRPQT